jgi:hypothetical protein
MRVSGILTAALLGTVAVSGCQCIDDNNLGNIPEKPIEEVVDPPPPPVFPLKEGDQLVLNPIGGRTDESDIGASDFAIRISWVVKGVALNDDNRWEITADALYEQAGPPAIPASAISRLALENVGDFPAIEADGSVTARDAVFRTDRAPAIDSGYIPNHFPFFQSSVEGNDGDDGEVFNEAAASFRETTLALDAEAKVDTQVAVGRFEAFFRDDLNGPTMLHKMRVDVHPFGFVCGWDEILIPFAEGMERGQAPFTAAGVPPLAAINFGIPQLTRDGTTYNCSCFQGTCRNNRTVDGVVVSTCLNPIDPDAAPGACP